MQTATPLPHLWVGFFNRTGARSDESPPPSSRAKHPVPAKQGMAICLLFFQTNGIQTQGRSISKLMQ